MFDNKHQDLRRPNIVLNLLPVSLLLLSGRFVSTLHRKNVSARRRDSDGSRRLLLPKLEM